MPDLRTIRGVELLKVGTWQPGGVEGDWTVTPEHLAAVIEAHRAGVLRKPPIKIGHTDPRFDGSPALGFVDNLKLADAGRTLVGDLVNVPAAVATLLPHAYPDRSIEALIDYQAPDGGGTWPLVLTALSLLGAEHPAVETLTSLQDVGALYGVPIAAKRIVLAARHDIPDRSRAVAVAAARRRRTQRITTKG